MFKHRNKAVAIGVALLVVSVLLVASIQPTTAQKAQFVLASWDFPDEYGQGIEGIEIYENSTGFWVMYDNPLYDEETNFDWNESVGIKLRCYTWLNSTLVNVSTTNEGKLYQRHSVVVTTSDMFVAGKHTVFSQQNFTWVNDDPIDPPMWYYGYEVVLNFLPVGGAIYTITITYEIYW